MKKGGLLLSICVLLCTFTLGGCGKEDAAFEYFYRGFLIQDNEQISAPEGVYVIDNQELYEAFFSTYGLGAIYPLTEIDFAQEDMIYYGVRSAMPTRGWLGAVTSLTESTDGTHKLILEMDEGFTYGGEQQRELTGYQLMTDTSINVMEVYMLKVKKTALSEEAVRANAWQAHSLIGYGVGYGGIHF